VCDFLATDEFHNDKDDIEGDYDILSFGNSDNTLHCWPWDNLFLPTETVPERQVALDKCDRFLSCISFYRWQRDI